MNNSSETLLAKERLERAKLSLEGLSIGDAFGDQWFYVPTDLVLSLLRSRALPAPVWEYTDDTQMALSIVSILRQYGSIDQDALAKSFATHYELLRKYGASMRGLFLQILDGIEWKQAASSLFEGQGSFGNGAAMRVAPIGAYFADDLSKAAEQGRRSAEVTHAHPEGIAGGIAVAVAAAVAWQAHNRGERPSRREFINWVIPYVPESEVRSKLIRAAQLASSIGYAAEMLGNGLQISAPDTVPLCLWCSGEYLDNYEEALWNCASVGGDIDTNCAIVGGIVSLYTGINGIPETWRTSREPLPSWPFMNDTAVS